MNLSNINMHSMSEALAWTIFHSIWQAALIAGLLALAFRIINKNNARLRYTMASISLLLILISAIFTFLLSLPTENLPLNLKFTGLDSIIITDTNKTVFSWSSLKNLLPTHILFPILLRTWIIGICLLSLRMVVNYTNALRLKKHKAYPLNKKHNSIANSVLERFEIRKKVMFRESSSVDSPSLIGYFKPVVLLPISLLSGIPDNQLEIIIAHELAHISRHDYLVQFTQGIIEILFFYHPMVWWLSSVVNTEREHICDDLAVKVCGESLTLIKALNNMESIRRKKPELVLSFSNKKTNLLHRVRRILNPVTVKHPKLERGLMSALFVFTLSGMILFSNLANSKNQIQNSKKFSIEDFDTTLDLSSMTSAPQKINQKCIAVPEKPLESSIPELPDLPEIPELSNKAIALPDTIKEVEKEALEEALKELENIEVEINEATIKELENSLKELESVDINIELREVEFDLESELETLSEEQYSESFKNIDEDDSLSEKEKEELKTKLKAAFTKVQLKDFQKTIRENLERSKESIHRQLEKIKSGEFQQSFELQKEKIKEMINKFESSEFQNKLKENLEKSRKHLKERLKELNKNIENSKTQKKTKMKFDSKNKPLCLLDGVKISDKAISKLDPSDIESLKVLKNATSISIYGEKGENGAILITSKNKVAKKKKSKRNKAIKIKGKTKTPPLYIVDGVEYKGDKSMKDIDPNNIESMTVLKDKSAIEKYGRKAKYGVVEITTKRNENQ